MSFAVGVDPPTEFFTFALSSRDAWVLKESASKLYKRIHEVRGRLSEGRFDVSHAKKNLINSVRRVSSLVGEGFVGHRR